MEIIKQCLKEKLPDGNYYFIKANRFLLFHLIILMLSINIFGSIQNEGNAAKNIFSEMDDKNAGTLSFPGTYNENMAVYKVSEIEILNLKPVINTITYKKNPKSDEAWKIIAVFTGSIILDAVGDGLKDKGEKEWGHVLSAASVGLLISSPFIIEYDKSKWGYYLTSYVGLRIAAFDYTYNATRGLPYNFIGNTSFWDKGLRKLSPPDGLAMGRIVSAIIGISMPINELGHRKQFRRNKSSIK